MLTFSSFDADAKSLLENLGWNDLGQQAPISKSVDGFQIFE